jgi:short-subunit dehydrogenase involved in D-alanine esterification of teichoic acids
MDLTNNVILLTGGTSGIGLEILKQFYHHNQIVVTSSKLENLELLKQSFPEIKTIECDLGKDESVTNLIEICRKEFPSINMIINNAGVQHNYNWLDDSDFHNEIENEIRINLISPFQIINGLKSSLLEKKQAAIVNVSSALAFVPKRSAPIYCASKAGIHIGTKALRYQFENTNVKIFEIIPPLVDTPMTKGRGKGKLSPEDLVLEFRKRFESNSIEINVGKTKLLRLIQRISPALADKILKNS